MKLLKNIYMLILITLISFIFIEKNNFKASQVYKSDNNNATWTVKDETTNTINGVTHSLIYGESTDISESSTGNQKVNIFEMKADGINSKFVTWAISGKTSYTRAGLSNIAKDYEKNHPGWMVVAGINGDQYYAKYGSSLGVDGSFYYYNQPYYPMIIDGERRFPITPTGGSSTNYVGFTNDGSVQSFVEPSTLDNIKIEVLNKANEVIYIHNIDKINQTPNNDETTIWITYNSSDGAGQIVEQNVKTDNNIYVIENAEKVYMNNSVTYPHGAGIDSLFAKGTISLVTNEFNFISGTFGIETTDKDLEKQLKEEIKVRVQYYYSNDLMNKVESSTGFHSVQRYNGNDVESPQPYDTRRYNRSIFGRKADGTYVLMTVAKGSFSGTTHNESNAILKQFGVEEAYQQDGGGSVTAIIRNNYDEFDIVNESSDSGSKERQIFSGCFFVVRDLGFRAYKKDSTKNSITLSKINNYNDEYISNIKAIVNNQTYEISNDTLTIPNLEYDTEYLINLTYDISINGKTVKANQQIIAHTDSFTMPYSGVKVVKTTANSITIERTKVSEDEYIYVEVLLNEQKYELKELNKQIEIKNLKPLTLYTFKINYAVKDSINGKIYEGTEEIQEVTKKYNIPEIKTFKIEEQTKKSIKINVEIIDDFQLAYAYYISYNGMQYSLEELSGTYIIEDLNLKKNEYELQLVVQYKENEIFKTLTSDSIYTTKVKSSCNKNNMMFINSITLSILLYISFRKRK